MWWKKKQAKEKTKEENGLGGTSKTPANGELVAALKEAFREAMGLEEGETLKSLFDTLGTKIDNLGDKIDGLGENLGRIPDRIVEELYGNQTVRWGQLILGIEIEDKGYKPARIGVKEVRFIDAITKGGGENKIDEVLIYQKDGERITFLLEGKHRMGLEEVQKAITQMSVALNTAKEFEEKEGAQLGKIVPVFIFHTKSDAKPIDEHIKSIEEWANERGVQAFVILPEGRIVKVGNDESKEV